MVINSFIVNILIETKGCLIMLKNNPIISIITPTHLRHNNLIFCIEQVKSQKFKYFEHIVVSDGIDREVENICKYYKINCFCIEKETNTGNSKGHAARDKGINLAKGDYIALWDDDNIYFPHALNDLYEASNGYDIGVCDVLLKLKSAAPTEKERIDNDIYKIIPQNWQGQFIIRNIDTMNVMTKKKSASLALWTESKKYEGDFYWLEKLADKGCSVNYVSKTIGIKI